ncbi:MAG: deoxyribodipyrimidine photo-lyase [Thermofilaceae archaeon]|nr:deoxyribodipyrimidine photo-lyase [Thermofilaceae archaeon]
MTRVIFWVKRELRTRDNRALFEAASRSDELIPVFVVDEQILEGLGIRQGDERLNFLFDALKHLNSKISLYVYVGKTQEVFEYLLDRYNVDAVYTAEPLTWEGYERCEKVKALCEKLGVK